MKYDYYCADNERTIEVTHSMSQALSTWGDLCKHVGTELGDTPADAPVKRVISGGYLALSKRGESGCGPCGGMDMGACGGGPCGFDGGGCCGGGPCSC